MAMSDVRASAAPELAGDGAGRSRDVGKVNRKKEKRGRRSPCGPLPRTEKVSAFFGRARPWKRLRRSTFQVNTMNVTVSNHRNGQRGTSSNVVTLRDPISS